MHKYHILIADIVNLSCDLEFSFLCENATFFERIFCHTMISGAPALYTE